MDLSCAPGRPPGERADRRPWCHVPHAAKRGLRAGWADRSLDLAIPAPAIVGERSEPWRGGLWKPGLLYNARRVAGSLGCPHWKFPLALENRGVQGWLLVTGRASHAQREDHRWCCARRLRDERFSRCP